MLNKKEMKQLAVMIGSSMNKDRSLNIGLFLQKLHYFLSLQKVWDRDEFDRIIVERYENIYLTKSGRDRKAEIRNGETPAKLNARSQAACEYAIQEQSMSEAARKFGLTREFIRQMLKAHYNITGLDFLKNRIEPKLERVRKELELNPMLTINEAFHKYKVARKYLKPLFPDAQERKERKMQKTGRDMAIRNGHHTIWVDVMRGLQPGQASIVDVSGLKRPHQSLHTISKRIGIPISLKLLGDGLAEITRTEQYGSVESKLRTIQIEELKEGQSMVVRGSYPNWRWAANRAKGKYSVRKLTEDTFAITRLKEETDGQTE
jgi:hypothetical protein